MLRRGQRQGQAAKRALPAIFGGFDGRKETDKQVKAQQGKDRSDVGHYSPTILMARRNLLNMVVVGVTSGVVLLTLLAVKHF